jgi:non-canonical purine NTP pyrophosphatase (RdgB/HAM1 family)
VRRLLIATRNHTRYLLLRPIFQRYGFEVIALRDIQLDDGPNIETGRTSAENALAKARRYHSETYPWVFGSDAGLEIDALNGEPGVKARRWGGRFADDVDDQTWLNYLLERMKDVPPERRTARFVVAWALIAPDGSEHVRNVRHPFKIAAKQIRPISPGAPISAVMLGPEKIVEARGEEIFQRFERWGILAELLKRFPE